MGLLCLSVRSRRSGLQSLDKLPASRAEELLHKTLQLFPGAAGVALRTCNRFELYFSMPEGSVAAVERLLGSFPGDPLQEVLRGEAVVSHLFEVTAGLDSELIGEDEIQGQVRTALKSATSEGCVDPELSELFERAIHVGRKVRRETRLHAGVSSLSRLAIDQVVGGKTDLKSLRFGILGSGQLGMKILDRLLRDGVRDIVVTARTAERRRQLREEWKVRTVPPRQLTRELSQFDVLFCAADGERPLLTLTSRSLGSRKGALTVVDLGVPPNLELKGRPRKVRLVTMADLQVESRRISRRKAGAIRESQRIVREETRSYVRLQEEQDVARFAERLLAQAEKVAQEEGTKALSMLSSPQDAEAVIRGLSKSLIKRLLLPSIVTLRDLSPAERAKAIEVAERLLIRRPSD